MTYEGPRRSGPATLAAALALVALTVAGACAGRPAGEGEGASRFPGRRIEVMAVWSGAEQEAFQAVARRFERATGATVGYTSAGHSMAAALDARLAGEGPPDVAFLPQPGLLRRYAREGRLVPLAGDVVRVVDENFEPVWRRLGSAGGRLYGVWFKAAHKSLVWYRLAAFEAIGAVPPPDLEGLVDVANRLADAGVAAFSVGGAAGWTLTDWFENLYLRQAGPARYDRLARHALAWTDVSVREALAMLGRLLDPRLVAGGVEGALTTGFEPSVVRVFTGPAEAAMTVEGDFVAGVVTSRTRARIGVDADVFAFPPATARGRDGTSYDAAATAVMGGGDAAVLLRPSGAGQAFLRFLATPEAAAVWARRGGFLSPNRNLDLAVYPDDLSRSLARGLLEAGDGFRFDLSDLAPAAFGGLEGQGMRAALQDFLRTRDVAATAARLEAEAAAAFGS
ncbi:MAG TPA: ABC transporter substrate-binding protein [Acidimicrobiales bacterium]|nr:ABC transporter substrate-binding protein [Acidimicrobiales bacterium]